MAVATYMLIGYAAMPRLEYQLEMTLCSFLSLFEMFGDFIRIAVPPGTLATARDIEGSVGEE